MTEYVRVASLSEIPDDEAKQVEIRGEKLALRKVDGNVYCINDICTHEHAYLSEGFCEGHEIECPLHGSIFDVRTGEVKSLPATQDVQTYPVQIQGDDVLVGVEEAGD